MDNAALTAWLCYLCRRETGYEVGVCGCLSLHCSIHAHNWWCRCGHGHRHRDRGLGHHGVLVLVCAVMLAFHCIHTPPDVAYVSVLSVAMAIFLAMMVVCNRNGFHQDYMWIVSYLVIGMLIVVQVFGVLMVYPPSASEGIWWTVFFIYIIYTLLPVRMRAAVVSGAVLSTIHLVIAWQLNQEYKFIFKQVSDSSSNTQREIRSETYGGMYSLVLLCVVLLSLFYYNTSHLLQHIPSYFVISTSVV